MLSIFLQSKKWKTKNEAKKMEKEKDSTGPWRKKKIQENTCFFFFKTTCDSEIPSYKKWMSFYCGSSLHSFFFFWNSRHSFERKMILFLSTFFFSLFSIKAMYKNRRPKPHKSRREFRKNHSDKAIFDRRGGGIEKRHFFYSIFTQSLIAFLVNRYCK